MAEKRPRRNAPPRSPHDPLPPTGPTTVRVRVTPRAGRDALAGWRDGALRVRLAAAPVEGRANEALVRLLAKAAGLPPSAVVILSGETAREKRVAFHGLDEATLHARLGIPPAPSD
jgi:uncharacterized protein (TIGR00251 family)